MGDAAQVSEEIDRAENLRVWLLETWEHDVVLPRDVVRLAPIRALRETPKARAALLLLVKFGWLAPIEQGAIIRGVKRREAYRIVRPHHVV